MYKYGIINIFSIWKFTRNVSKILSRTFKISKMKPSLDEKTSSGIVLKLYNGRKKVFIQSLQTILQKIAQDRIVKQMLQDRSSGQFITKRIEEIVAQVIFDDREIYIDTLVQKLNAYEKLYSKDQAQMIRNLGTKILSISDAQNAGEVHYVRQIQTLNEQVQALQAEIVNLRTQKADHDVSITDISRDLRVRTLDPDYNPNSPTFMHIFGRVDLTDYKVRLKLIHTDASTSRQLVVILMNKMKKICSIMRSKTKQSIKAYAKITAEYEQQRKLEMIKAKDVQKHYEDDVIPQLIARHKESMSKHRKIHQNNKQEIDKLNEKIANYEEELNSLKSNQKRNSSQIDTLNKQIVDKDSLIADLKAELQKVSKTAQTQKNQLLEKERTINQLQDDVKQSQSMHQRLNKDVQNLQQELNEANSHIDSLENELEQARNTIPRTERALKETSRELEELKRNNEELNKNLNQRNRELTEVQRKLNKIEPVYESNQRELKKLKDDFSNLQDENTERKRKYESLKHDNEAKSQQISKLEQSLNEFKASVAKHSKLVNDLEAEKDQHQNEIYEIKSQLKKQLSENAKIDKQLKENQSTINKQKDQIDQKTEENEKLKESIRKANKKNSQIEADLQKVLSDLETARAEVEEFRNAKVQHEEQAQIFKDEKTEMKQKIRDLSQEIKDKEMKSNEKISELKSQNQDLQDQNETINNKVNELENQLKSLKKAKKENEEQILSQEKTINQLKQDNNVLREKHSKAADQAKQNKESLGNLENQNRTYKKAFDEIIQHLPGNLSYDIEDVPDAVKELAENKKLLEQVYSTVGNHNPSELINSLKDLKDNKKILKKVSNMLGSKDINEIPSDLQQLKNEHENLTNDQKKLRNLFKDKSQFKDLISDDDDNPDLYKLVAAIIKKQNSYKEDLDSAAKFISKVLSTITNSQETPFNFPVKNNVTDQLLKIVKQIKDRADADQKNINAIIERAKSLGYDGTDCMKACEYIVQQMSETEKQKTFESISKELDAVRDTHRKKEEALNSQIAKLKKKNNALRVTIGQQQSQAAEREDELSNTLQQYEQQIRDLTDQLETERRIREELGKIGDGFSADTKYLKSKLSAKELKFFTFIQKVMQSDKNAKEIHMKMKQERENLFTDQLSTKT